MVEGESPRDKLLKYSLMSFQEEYKDINDSWKLMDSKAQSSGTIAGFFLAAAFALARQLPMDFLSWQRYLLCVGIGLFIMAVCLALLGMHIRRISPQRHGESVCQPPEGLGPSGGLDPY